MPLLKKFLLLSSIFTYILTGLATRLFISFINPRLSRKIITSFTRVLSVALRKILGIKLEVEGELSYFNETGNFIIANHLSYLDGVILSGLFKLIFVTKLEVKSWPVLGWMTQTGSTIFIDRKKRLESANFIARISGALEENFNVLFFPEGTSTDGSKILPFKQACFQAPINAGASVIPVTIQYTKINSHPISPENRDAVCWYGQVKFAGHLFNLLKQKQIEAKIIIHPKIEAGPYAAQANSRKQLSDDALVIIASKFAAIE